MNKVYRIAVALRTDTRIKQFIPLGQKRTIYFIPDIYIRMSKN